MKRALVALIVGLCSTTLAAQDGARRDGRFRMAESPLCPTAYQNAEQCHRNWKGIGGGSSGQAGSFRECLKVYCNAMIAGGCARMPSGCDEI